MFLRDQAGLFVMSAQSNKPTTITLSWREIHDELRPRGKINKDHWVADIVNLFAGPVRRLVKSRKRNTRRQDVVVLNTLTKKERRCVFKNAVPCPWEGVILRRGAEFYKEVKRDYRGATYENFGSAEAPATNTTENAGPSPPPRPASGVPHPNSQIWFANYQIWFSNSQIWSC